MAHPLTQQPPNMIGFGAPATMSPLGFGFGQPYHSPGFSGGVRPSGVSGFGFGALASPSTAGPSMTPLKRIPPPRSSPAPTTPMHHASAKRSRRASASPSTSPSPLGSPSLSKRRDVDDDIDDHRRKIAGKASKRLRKEDEGAVATTDGPDLGLLLGKTNEAYMTVRLHPTASFPATSHLPILLELLNENPSLAPRVLGRIPQPPLQNCLETLERIVSKIGKATGSWEPQDGYVATRRWNRAEDQVGQFTKTASTYLKFFTTPPEAGSSVEPNTIYHLLHDLTAHILQILALVPEGPPPAARPFLEVARSVLDSWGQWIGGLSNEVNNRGGMYPASMVSSWADGLETLAREPAQLEQQVTPMATLSSWATPISLPPTPTARNPLVQGFRDALQPHRQRFVNELGWLVVRQ